MNDLYDHRSEPNTRSVLEDYERSQGCSPTRLGLALSYLFSADADAAAADAAADDAATAAAAADADDAAAAAADAAADDADDVGAAAADADDAADAADAAARSLSRSFLEEPDMHDGLKIIQIPGSYGYWATTLVGWMRRVSGDEWELLPGARVLWRQRGSRAPNGLDIIATKGPGEEYGMSDPTAGSEEIHRLIIRRSRPANEKVWAEYCPRPKGWK